MDELVVVRFHDRRRAAKVVDLLWRMNDALTIELEDAVTVLRNRGGNLEFETTCGHMHEKGIIKAGVMGFLIGFLIATPPAIVLLALGQGVITGIATVAAGVLGGAAIGFIVGVSDAIMDMAWWRDHLGFDACFVREADYGIGPGDSAILAWIDPRDLDMVAKQFTHYGGEVHLAAAPSAQILSGTWRHVLA
jgi:uncharacterized membrane protein